MSATDKHATVCGFSFGRNLSKLNYPVEAAVGSVLPLCDRFVFAVGQSDDDTRRRVEAISPKIEIIDTTWPDVQVDGGVLAIEANKAMAAAQATGCTWGFYIQADEVIHEDDHATLRSAMDHWADDPAVKALLFRYLHFVLDYRTTDPWMYHKASRIVRLDGSCEIFGDACGPGLKNYTGTINDGYLDKRHLGGHVRWACGPGAGPAAGPAARKARVFHYGWVKTRQELDEKFQMVEKLWWGTLDKQEMQRRKTTKFGAFADRYSILKNHLGSHPGLMQDRITAHPPYAPRRNRWLNPRFYAQVLRHGFHG
jgi:hypothetical protein